MQLSVHFSLEEFMASQTADHLGIDNEPPLLIVERLKVTANALELVREILGKPIHVNSGYRCEALNMAVRGVRTSAHVLGYGVDFICPQYGSPLKICQALLLHSQIRFDQVIEEGTWVHLSVDPRMRNQVLTKKPGGGYSTGLRH